MKNKLLLLYLILLSIVLLNRFLQTEHDIPLRTNQFFVSLLMYVTPLLFITRRKIKIKTNFVYFFLLAYSSWVLIATLYVDNSLLYSSIFLVLQLGVFFIINSNITYTEKDIKTILKFISVLAIFLSSVFLVSNSNLVVNLFLGQHINYSNILPVLGNKNADATLFICGFASLYILYKINPDKIKFSLLILILSSLLLTFSRSVFVALFIFIVTFALFNNTFKKNIILSFSSLPILLLFFYSDFLAGNFLRIDRGMSGRYGLWDVAFSVSQDNRVFGIGIGQWSNYTGLTYSPHNAYLKVLVEFGVVGLILYLALTFSIILLGIKTYKNSVKKNIKIVCAGLTAFLVAMTVRHIFETTTFGDTSFNAIFFTFMTSLIIIVYNNSVIMNSNESINSFNSSKHL